MEVFQRSILGGGITISSQKLKKASAENASFKRSFPEINLNSGIHDKEAEANAMLVLRSLQKKLLFNNLKNKKMFQRIVGNEIQIKTGKMDSLTAARDALIAFYAKY